MFFYYIHLAKLDNGNSCGVKYTIRYVRADIVVIATNCHCWSRCASHWAMEMVPALRPPCPASWASSARRVERRLCVQHTCKYFVLCTQTQKTETQKNANLKETLVTWMLPDPLVLFSFLLPTGSLEDLGEVFRFPSPTSQSADGNINGNSSR